MASILAARKLAQYDGGKRVPATMSAIADAVRWAEAILKEIDERWPQNERATSQPCAKKLAARSELVSSNKNASCGNRRTTDRRTARNTTCGNLNKSPLRSQHM